MAVIPEFTGPQIADIFQIERYDMHGQLLFREQSFARYDLPLQNGMNALVIFALASSVCSGGPLVAREFETGPFVWPGPRA